VSSDCIAYAVGAGGSEDGVVEGCAGALGAGCPDGSCCADDPRDGCALGGTGGGCGGVCVGSSGCAPGEASCGICVDGFPPAGSCTRNVDCGAQEACSRPVGGCAQVGQCVPLPSACPTVFDPVCGCDGATYSNACVALAAGTSVATEGPCGGVCGDGTLDEGEGCDPVAP